MLEGPPIPGWWWEIKCNVVDGEGRPILETASEGSDGGGDAPSPGGGKRASCDTSVGGLRAVVVLEKVQTGILGATLSSFGITGEHRRQLGLGCSFGPTSGLGEDAVVRPTSSYESRCHSMADDLSCLKERRI
jgi:hypothetical protein